MKCQDQRNLADARERGWSAWLSAHLLPLEGVSASTLARDLRAEMLRHGLLHLRRLRVRRRRVEDNLHVHAPFHVMEDGLDPAVAGVDLAHPVVQHDQLDITLPSSKGQGMA